MTGPRQLPEVRRWTEDHRRHLGRRGHRAHPRAAGAITTTLAGPHPDAARGLTRGLE